MIPSPPRPHDFAEPPRSRRTASEGRISSIPNGCRQFPRGWRSGTGGGLESSRLDTAGDDGDKLLATEPADDVVHARACARHAREQPQHFVADRMAKTVIDRFEMIKIKHKHRDRLAVRDPERPARMLPAYDSGDHLHPGDAGLRALAESIDLRELVR